MSDGDVVVDSVSGKVRGRTVLGGTLFAGIPYAEPSVGIRRFQPPRSPRRWDGIWDASVPGPACPQLVPGAALAHWARAGALHTEISEDCLYLNVLTPAADAASRPVLVWIHGGGLQTGSGDAWPYLEGGYLGEDIVLVTLNYRLNLFGFLYLDEDFDEAAGTGNLGHLDQIAALEWVANNIAAFGGDPTNVTVFGESAGGFSVAQLLAMPRARGLFRAAIVQSGSLEAAVTTAAARETTRSVLASLGIAPGDWTALLNVPVERLLDELTPGRHPGPRRGLPGAFVTVLGDSTVAADPAAAIARGSASGTNVIVGMTRNEWSGLRLGLPPGTLPAPEYGAAAIDCRVSEETMRQFYRGRIVGSGAGDPEEMEHAAFATDWLFGMPTANLADALVTGGARVWRYRFDWQSPVQDGVLGAFHAIDLPFTFAALDEPNMLGPTPPAALADGMRGAWAAFARTGHPGTVLDVAWPQYEHSDRIAMSLRTDPELLHDPDRALLPAWAKALRFRP